MSPTTTTPRPAVTRELVADVARKMCEREGWLTGSEADDITRVYRQGMDGYAIAKALDDSCYWDCDMPIVEALDTFDTEVRGAHRKLCIAWASENNIQPPLPIGTQITIGEITGIYEHDAAYYEVRVTGETNDKRRRLVRFEDVKAVDVAATGAPA